MSWSFRNAITHDIQSAADITPKLCKALCLDPPYPCIIRKLGSHAESMQSEAQITSTYSQTSALHQGLWNFLHGPPTAHADPAPSCISHVCLHKHLVGSIILVTSGYFAFGRVMPSCWRSEGLTSPSWLQYDSVRLMP
jgi:hypothetical protein